MHVRSRTSKKDLEIFEKFKNKNFFDSKEVSHISKLLPEKEINILEIGFGAVSYTHLTLPTTPYV